MPEPRSKGGEQQRKNCNKKQTRNAPRKANACTVETKAVGPSENSTAEYTVRPETSIARIAYECLKQKQYYTTAEIEFIQQYIDADEFHERSCSGSAETDVQRVSHPGKGWVHWFIGYIW